ncbi:MAG: bifunctional NAD(P)H-hydrate repair enzyme Nnr [Acidimicrobiia bacterium]
MRILTAAQMREADRRTIEDIGIPSIVLMENAGRQVVTAIDGSFEQADTLTYAVLCGKGHNGGDGFVVARTLMERGVAVTVYLVGKAGDVRGDARTNLGVLERLGADIVEIADATAWELHAPAVLGADVIVDAIFGTGLSGPVHGLVASIVEDVNASDVPVVAVDVPTGIDAGSSDVPGPAVEATVTVTFAAPKIAHVLPPAEHHAGSLVIADIGIPEAVVQDLDGAWFDLLTSERLRAAITPRAADSQKGDYGRVLIVAGSQGKTGAAYLAAMACLRSGAGLVTVATPKSCVPILASLGVEYMTLGLEETDEGTLASSAVEDVLAFDADVIVVGPGLGRHASTQECVRNLVERAGVPMVLDADALVAFSEHADALMGREDTPLVLTPHPGEMGRLLGLTVDQVQASRLDITRDFASTHQVHLILKGHRTLLGTPEGRVSLNVTGNPGMATGGTGDVLAGMVGAWCAQTLDPTTACQLAIYLHGRAGDLAADAEGEIALTAGDLLDHLGDAVLELSGRVRSSAGQA